MLLFILYLCIAYSFKNNSFIVGFKKDCANYLMQIYSLEKQTFPTTS